MAKLRELRTTFSAGEVDPLVVDRSDIKQYFQGLERGRNIILLAPGGFRRRPGSLYRADLSAYTMTRLLPFQFSLDQQYVFAFSPTRLDVFSTAGALLASYTGQVWTATEIPEMTVDQAGDVMIVTHRSFVPRKITRTGASSFTIASYTVEVQSGVPRQMYYKFAPAEVTIAPSGTAIGAITVTTSAAYWSASHTGLYIRIQGKTVLLGAFIDGSNMNATVIETLATTTAVVDWDEQVMGNAVHGLGFNAVAFHEDRLWFGGHSARRSGVWGSRVGAYYNHLPGSNDADAIATGLQSGQVNEVFHLLSHNHLLILCDGGEFFVPTSQNRPITPATIVVKRQSGNGTTRKVRPAVFDKAGLYAQATGNVVRDLNYDDTQQAYSSEAVSLLSTHLIRTPVDLAILPGTTDRPEQYAFCVNGSDGSMAVFNSLKSERITGWTLWTTDGLYKSVCVAGGKLFAIVERTIGGLAKRYLEEFGQRYTLDSIGTDETVSLGQLTGLNHLIAKTVKVTEPSSTTEISYVGEFVVDGSGNINGITDLYGLLAHAGLDYEVQAKGLPVEVQLPTGTIVGLVKRLNRVDVSVYESHIFDINGRRLLWRDVDDDFSLTPELLTELLEVHLLGWGKSVTFDITQPYPLPLTVRSVVCHFKV